MTTTITSIDPIAPPVQVPAIGDTPRRYSESPGARQARLIDEGLAAGVQVLSYHQSVSRVTSAHGGPDYAVFSHTYESQAIRVESCNCEWGQRVGDIETYNPGTVAATANRVDACKHVFIRRWWELSGPEREAVAARYPRLHRWVLWGYRPLA